MNLYFSLILLQIFDVLYGFPAMHRKSASDALRDPNLFDGDIVLRHKKHKDMNYNGVPEDDLLWPNGVIYYEIDRQLVHIQPMIEQSIRHIQEETQSCIQFRRRSFEHNYVYITPGEGSNCRSEVGMSSTGGRQDLELGYNCRYVGTILHELMHVIGFYHEHSRSDRDEFIRVHYENIIAGMEDNFEKLKETENRLLEPFDYHSITIYGEFGFSKNGQPTMLPKQHGQSMTDPYFKHNLSPFDSKAVKKLYKCF